MVNELTRLSVQLVTEEELSRAKNMLKSLMMTQLESRLVLCEDIGRQYITYGSRESPAVLCTKIEQVKAEDIRKAVQKMIVTKPCVGFVGPDLTTVPDYEQIFDYATFVREEGIKKLIR
jgi:processing peptidase subunit alpha